MSRKAALNRISEEDYHAEVWSAFQKCCRAFIVQMDEEEIVDALYSGILSKDLDAYDRQRIEASILVGKIVGALKERNLNAILKRGEGALLEELDSHPLLLNYLTEREWDNRKKEIGLVPCLLETMSS